MDNTQMTLLPPRKELERAFAAKDASYDGVFFVAVRTTGIFCRPSCSSRPQLGNVEFFSSIRDAIFAGYRACKRCHPLEVGGKPPEWVSRLMHRTESDPDIPLKSADLRAVGVSPERARRWFQQNYGMTFAAWCRGCRLAGAFTSLREGSSLDDAAFDSGYDSLSGFREAFTKVFGKSPGESRRGSNPVMLSMFETPLGPMLAGANSSGITLLEFSDRRMLEHNLQIMRRRFPSGVLPGRHALLDQLRQQLDEYFAGARRQFTLPLTPLGTPFQEKVWQELRKIPHGATISYDDLAARIGQPTAQRAVARANGMNRICILIPCHRVIGKDGTLTGYGGGLWRKRLLIELERTGSLPGQVGVAKLPGAGPRAENFLSGARPPRQEPGGTLPRRCRPSN